MFNPAASSSTTSLQRPTLAKIIVNKLKRATSFRAQFIEIYVGTQRFDAASLDVVVAIYVQAFDRLYEVILMDKDTAQEISRFYVYEDELTHSMKNRLKALTTKQAIRELNTHEVTAAEMSTSTEELTVTRDFHSPPNSQRISAAKRRDSNINSSSRKNSSISNRQSRSRRISQAMEDELQALPKIVRAVAE
jgi:hypothetical protein